MNPLILADNRFSDGTPSATDTATGYDVLNVRDLKTYTAWQAASSGTKYITVDCSSDMTSDTLAISAHNLGTAVALVSVESSANGSSWTERLAPFTPSNDKTLMKTFTPVSARFWRLKIVTGSIAPEISVCMIGEALEFEYPPEGPYTPVSESIEAQTATSKTGVILGVTVWHRPLRINPSWKNLSRTWVDNYLIPFWDNWASLLVPFFWAWDLDTYPSSVQFVRIDEGFNFSPSVSMIGYYDDVRLQMSGMKE